MDLILADPPAPQNMPALSIAAITAALTQVNNFQAMFRPGQPLAAIGALVDQLFGTDQQEAQRLQALIPQVKNDLANNYRALTGQPLWDPFTPEKAAWLQIAINQQAQVANSRYQQTGDRVQLRYVRAFQELTRENENRLLQAKRQVQGPDLQTIGLGISAIALLGKITNSF